MKLATGEKIMVLRTRIHMEKQELGKLAFPDMLAPHVKIKKFESGAQIPNADEIAAIAKVLNVPVSSIAGEDGIHIEPMVFEVAPSFKYYIGMMNDAARAGKPKLIKTVLNEMCSDGDLMPSCTNPEEPTTPSAAKAPSKKTKR